MWPRLHESEKAIFQNSLSSFSIISECYFSNNFHQITIQCPIALLAKASIPCSSGAAGVRSIPANSDAQNVPSFRRWLFKMKLSPYNTEVLAMGLVVEYYVLRVSPIFPDVRAFFPHHWQLIRG
jgi:hypothetical protein